MNSREVVVKVINISKKFKKKRALDGISFAVNRGEVFGIIGPNGAGKTTLINILLGLIYPDSGEVKIFNKNLYRNTKFIKEKINFTSSYVSLPREINVVNNLKMFALLYGIKKIPKKINYLIKLLGLKEVADSRKPLEYFSTGEKARLSIAKSLINDPEVLFLDEATASLDPKITKYIIDLLKKLNKKKKLTIVYTTHRLEEVKQFGGRVCYLEAGKIKYLKRK